MLSARTAALLAPYADAPDESGFMVTEFDDLASAVTRIHEAGFPVAIHAIGDRAVRASLDAFERAAGRGPRPQLADRIEHVEVLDPEDAPRFEELGVLASFNPHHCITGIDIYNTDRLGEARAAWSFAWGAVRDAGATLVFGSDWATAPLDPLRQLYAATVREKARRRTAGRVASGAAGLLAGSPDRLYAGARRRRRLGWRGRLDRGGEVGRFRRAERRGPGPARPFHPRSAGGFHLAGRGSHLSGGIGALTDRPPGREAQPPRWPATSAATLFR